MRNRPQMKDLRAKISSAKPSPKIRALPKAFTEKGLYMLATVLKSRRAVDATFAIIETFAKVCGLKRELVELHNEKDRKRQSEKMNHFGETLADIVMPILTRWKPNPRLNSTSSSARSSTPSAESRSNEPSWKLGATGICPRLRSVTSHLRPHPVKFGID